MGASWNKFGILISLILLVVVHFVLEQTSIGYPNYMVILAAPVLLLFIFLLRSLIKNDAHWATLSLPKSLGIWILTLPQIFIGFGFFLYAELAISDFGCEWLCIFYPDGFIYALIALPAFIGAILLFSGHRLGWIATLIVYVGIFSVSVYHMNQHTNWFALTVFSAVTIIALILPQGRRYFASMRQHPIGELTIQT
jgi:hypothetical protein